MKKALLLLTLALSNTMFADEIKKGIAYVGVAEEVPSIIEITLKGEAAELAYAKLDISEVMTSGNEFIQFFEKRTDSIACKKFSSKFKNSKYSCKVLFDTNGNIK